MLDDVFSNVEPRLEMKIREGVAFIPEFRAWLLTHPCAFKVAYPLRQVNNIYFDTLGLDAYIDHISGVDTHNKLRYRWYGKAFSKIVGNFELKRKESEFIKKIFCPIRTKIDLKNENWANITEKLRSTGDDIFKLLMINSQPVLINSYQREYYVSGKNKFRVTIDYGMRAYDQKFHREPNLSFRTPLVSDAVIEIKCELANMKYAESFLKDIPFRITKNSKYVTAISAYS